MFRPIAVCAVLTVSSYGAAVECDRACLKAALDQYLNAVVKHDPSAAPLFAAFRQTENAVVVRDGMGLWKGVTALGKVQRRYLDPVNGQAAYFGTIEEEGGAAVVTARIKVEHKKITEAEWYVARRNDPQLSGPLAPGQVNNVFDPENLAKLPPPERVVPKEMRASREALVAVTNSYFDGITTHDGSIIMAEKGCMRVENGTTMTGRPGRGGGGPSDCTTGLENINIQMVAARRYPVVDEEQQVVLAMAVFLRKPGTTTRRNVFAEWFAIDNNKIHTVHSAMFYPAPEVPVPNWPPYEGNWPLPASFPVPGPVAGK